MPAPIAYSNSPINPIIITITHPINPGELHSQSSGIASFTTSASPRLRRMTVRNSNLH